MFNWYREITPVERKTFWTCFAGWGTGCSRRSDVRLVIPALIATWHVSNTEAGLISAVTLITSALGGWFGGALADRYGRVRALQITILWFSIATFLSAFAQSFGQLLVLKGFQGFGFGGEWAVGAVLMGEMIRPEHRGKALGTVQAPGRSAGEHRSCCTAWPSGCSRRISRGGSCSPSVSCPRCSSSMPAATSRSRRSMRRSGQGTLPSAGFCSGSLHRKSCDRRCSAVCSGWARMAATMR